MLRKSEPCTSTPDLSSNRMKGQPRSDDKDAHAVHVLLTDSKDLAPMPYTSKSGGVSVAQTDKSRSVAIMEQVSQEADEVQEEEQKEGRSPMIHGPIHKTTKSASDLINKILHMRMLSKGSNELDDEHL